MDRAFLPLATTAPLFYTAIIPTPLGPMQAIADAQALVMLDFSDSPSFERKLSGLPSAAARAVISDTCQPIAEIIQALKGYFAGHLQHFTTPLHLIGSLFQQDVWRLLQTIPYGETWSYSEQARLMQRPSSMRAVANANAANRLSIIIPCHRIIRHNGALGGYAGGMERKLWLLAHEERWKNQAVAA